MSRALHPGAPATKRPDAPLGSHPIIDRGALAVGVLVALMVVPAVAWVRLSPGGVKTMGSGVELLALAAAALLTLSIALAQIFVHIRRFGGAVIRGNRDAYPHLDGLAGRLARAHANAVESLGPFAAVVLATKAFGISNGWTMAGALLYLGARVVHAISYSAGITVLRSAAFYAGVVAVVMTALQLPWLSALGGN